MSQFQIIQHPSHNGKSLGGSSCAARCTGIVDLPVAVPNSRCWSSLPAAAAPRLMEKLVTLPPPLPLSARNGGRHLNDESARSMGFKPTFADWRADDLVIMLNSCAPGMPSLKAPPGEPRRAPPVRCLLDPSASSGQPAVKRYLKNR